MMNAYNIGQTALHIEYLETCHKILELLEELDAVEILRAQTPPIRRNLLDRLESALRLLDRISDDLDDCSGDVVDDDDGL
jgi:hypothetical protein